MPDITGAVFFVASYPVRNKLAFTDINLQHLRFLCFVDQGIDAWSGKFEVLLIRAWAGTRDN